MRTNIFSKILLLLTTTTALYLCKNTSGSSLKEDVGTDYLTFLKGNSEDLFSNTPVFFDAAGRRYLINMDTVPDEYHLISIIKRHGLLFSYQMTNDPTPDSILTTRILIATALKNQNTWHLDIPENIFRNYLLPHKVLYEDYHDWHGYFSTHFDSILSFVPKSELSRKQIDSLIETHVIRLKAGNIFTSRTSSLRISKWPGMDELRIANSGDCQSESIKNVYLYRSLGIPAAMDFTPFYGGGNAGHSSAVFWNSRTQRFTPKAGQGFNPDCRVAKVFRWSYERTGKWQKEIVPFIKDKLTFPISDLRNDHWIDVTEDHASTKDIRLGIPGTSEPLAYICTYTYGRWRPIYYGKRSNGTYFFKNMAVDILYQGGCMAGDSIKLTGSILHLRKDGSLHQVNESHTPSGHRANIKLSKINYGNEAWIKRQGNYSLLGLNSEGTWDTLAIRYATQDSTLVFQNVPARKVYLLKDNHAKKDLERPFMVKKDSIIWY